MAKLIAPTPTLHGKDADEFAKRMFEPFSEEKKAHFKRVLEMFDDDDMVVE